MDPRSRRRGLAVAAGLLVLLDLAIRRWDAFGPLVRDTVPASFFASVNAQVTDAIRTLEHPPATRDPVVLLGNSQMDFGSRPLPAMRDALVAAGAPTDTSVVPLFVYASAISDAEILTRSIARLRPRVVVLGVSAPDVGTPIEVARVTPVERILDVGLRDGPVEPGSLEDRLDRWVRTTWRLWARRALFADLLAPATGRRVPRDEADRARSRDEVLAAQAGPGNAALVRRLRPAFEAGEDWAAVEAYLAALQGPGYLPGLRERWRDLAPQPVQERALRALARHVREAGATPVFALLPENPLLERDPEIGGLVRARSDAAARAVERAAREGGAVVVDLRQGFPPTAFLDLNHLFRQHGGFAPRLAGALAERGVLTGS